MSKLIPNPNPQEVAAGRTKVFDTWLVNSPDPNNNSNPMYALKKKICCVRNFD
jgi:hypothetical protein